ncbi:Sec1 family domain-containing protein 2 [Chionoecetes opilio]|uniref:Sec1 family domain-containing protein 2 n=1 Tax=Chionoecetes opilio TaxID=41210 RepID=A0A8J4YIT1_CHIOP|nr:Sec1 family domain-containing protein 2 [Chionoecetes opilio]
MSACAMECVSALMLRSECVSGVSACAMECVSALMLSASSAGDVSEVWWGEACKKVAKAVVFVDAAAAEALHWGGGLGRLADAGAKNVKEFSSFEKGGERDVKATFLLSGPVRGTTATTLQHIIQASRFQYCVVITAAHPSVHSYARYGGREVDDAALIAELEQSVLTWMGNMNYTVEILYIPLVVAPYNEDLFFMPAFTPLYPLLSPDVPRIAKHHQAVSRGDKIKPPTALSEVEFHHLPHEMRVCVRQLVASLHSLLQGMDAREEVFTLGQTAHIIGTELDVFPPARQRRKVATNKISLVIVDRTLDLVDACGHGGDTLMARIMALLPRLPGHCIDSAVNMAPLCNVHPSCEWTLVPGCLAPQGKERRASEVLRALVTAPTKDTLALINNHVLEVGGRKEPPPSPDSPSKEGGKGVGVQSLKRNIQQFASDIDAFTDNAALLQHTPRGDHLDRLLTLEKRLLQALGDPEEASPFTQILQLLRSRKGHAVTLDDLLGLMVYVTSLGGGGAFTRGEEYDLVNLLSQAIMEDKDDLSDLMLELVGEEVDEVSALKTAQRVSGQLHGLATAREHLKNYRSVHVPGEGAAPACYRGVVARLLGDCLAATQGEVPDLEYKSAGLKDIIKTGFSLFVNVSKPSPRDAPLTLVWVVGGVTAGEVREGGRAVTSPTPAPPTRLVIGSSHLAHTEDTLLKTLQPNFFLKGF